MLVVKLLFSTLAFFFGASLGSWANMLAYRLRRGIPVWSVPRSFCDHCGSTLGVIDLLPIFGWAISRGRARCCGGKISPAYPLVELSLGCVAVLVVWLWCGNMGCAEPSSDYASGLKSAHRGNFPFAAKSEAGGQG